MTSDERIERLERAVGAVAHNVARIAYLRPADDVGVIAAQQLAAEWQEVGAGQALAERRRELGRQIAELDGNPAAAPRHAVLTRELAEMEGA